MKKRRPMSVSTKKKISRAKRKALLYAGTGSLIGGAAAGGVLGLTKSRSMRKTRNLMDTYTAKSDRLNQVKKTLGLTYAAGLKDPVEKLKYGQLEKLYNKKYKPMEAEVSGLQSQLKGRQRLHQIENLASPALIAAASLGGATLGLKYANRTRKKKRK